MSAEFIVSARKYRPTTFESVVGQKSITTTLKNAVKTGKLAHAYLFSGPRGVGKTTCARIFAKTINCQNPTPEGEACNQCESCKAFNEGRSFSIHELDAASNNSVDDIRKLIEQVRIPPQIGSYSVYIIDEVHMLSQAAFNAFLKTLEEPPKHAIFIMATTEKHKILPTILSRCQVFDFHRIKISDIVEHLANIAQKEGIHAEEDALTIIAQKADGAMRDALSFFDQLVSFTNGELTYKKVIEHLNVLDYEYYFKLTDLFLEGNYPEVMIVFDEILEKGFDAHNFLLGLSEHFRNLLVVKNKSTLELLEVGQNIKEKYKEQTTKASVAFLFKALSITNNFDVNYKNAKNKRLHVELALLQLTELSQKVYQEIPQITQTETKEQPKTGTENKQPVVQAQKEQTQSPKKTQEQAQEPQTQKKTLGAILQQTAKVSAQSQTTNEKQPAAQSAQKLLLNEENLKSSLLKFAQEFYPNKPIIHATLKIAKSSINGQTIQLALSNELVIEQLEKDLNQLSKFLQETFAQELKISFSLIKTNFSKPQRPADKYKFLRKKNSNLDKLQKLFDLEFK